MSNSPFTTSSTKLSELEKLDKMIERFDPLFEKFKYPKQDESKTRLGYSTDWSGLRRFPVTDNSKCEVK
jgi:hypothetical protein